MRGWVDPCSMHDLIPDGISDRYIPYRYRWPEGDHLLSLSLAEDETLNIALI